MSKAASDCAKGIEGYSWACIINTKLYTTLYTIHRPLCFGAMCWLIPAGWLHQDTPQGASPLFPSPTDLGLCVLRTNIGWEH